MKAVVRNTNRAEIVYVAGVVELVDAPDSKSGFLREVRVRVPPPAFFPLFKDFFPSNEQIFPRSR